MEVDSGAFGCALSDDGLSGGCIACEKKYLQPTTVGTMGFAELANCVLADTVGCTDKHSHKGLLFDTGRICSYDCVEFHHDFVWWSGVDATCPQYVLSAQDSYRLMDITIFSCGSRLHRRCFLALFSSIVIGRGFMLLRVDVHHSISPDNGDDSI
jgi:hypothetical protein